jgi:uncharacterized protein YprB with RNaseH-like and TPR domain
LHIPGVGPSTEQRLWQAGVLDWDIGREGSGQTKPKINRKILDWLDKSQRAVQNRDSGFFAELFPSNQLWRIYPDFKDSCLFFDIETTGLGSPDDYVTTVATFDGTEVRTFVYGQNLDDFPDYIYSFDLIVSYNGKCFDAPFLERQFGGLGLSSKSAHIDLRYVLRKLGYSGGLKACEQSLNLTRPSSLHDVDGFLAVLLWQEYLNGTPRALESLLCYNVHDAVNLRWLLQRAYNLAVDVLPIKVQPLKIEPRPAIDFKGDSRLIKSLLPWM